MIAANSAGQRLPTDNQEIRLRWGLVDEGPMVGRHIQEGDVLYTDVPRDHVLALKRDLLSGDELAVLDEIIAIKQREYPTYGVM